MNRIKQLRNEKNMLQSDVAKYIGKSERLVGFYENGKRDPSTETLSKLAELFEVSIDYILCKSNVRNLEENEKKQFEFAYHKEMEGLTDEEISDALKFYKEMKKKINKDTN